MQQNVSNSTPSGPIKTPHKPPVLKNNPNQPDSTNLKNFFQNLLNKNAPTPANTSAQSSTLPSNPVLPSASMPSENTQSGDKHAIRPLGHKVF